MLRGVQYPNNSVFSITDIGEGSNALICQTDRIHCCKQERIGEWYYPNGTTVPIEGGGYGFYRNREGNGTVRLNRRNNAVSSTGLFHCEVPDANGVNHVHYIGLLLNGIHNSHRGMLGSYNFMPELTCNIIHPFR